MSDLVGGVRGFSVARVLSHIRTPLYRNAYTLMFGSAMSAGLGAMYWVLAARQYTTHEVGLGSALVSSIMFLAGLSQTALSGTLIRFIPCAGRSTRRLVGFAYLATLVVSAFGTLVFVLGLGTWSPAINLSLDPLLKLGFGFAAVIWCVFVLQDNVLTGLRQSMWVLARNVICGFARIVLLVVLSASWQQHGILVSWVIPAVVAFVPIHSLIFRRLVPEHVSETENRIAPIIPLQVIIFAVIDCLGSFFGLMTVTLVPIIVVNQAGISANAYFYPSWMIVQVLYLIPHYMATSLTVETAADWTKLVFYSRRVLVHTVRLLTPAVIIVLVGAPYILGVFGKTYATEGAMLFRLLALATIPASVNSLYGSLARVQRRIVGMVVAPGAVCILGFGLSYILLKSWGGIGVGVAWLVSQTVVAAVLMLTQLRPILYASRKSGAGSWEKARKA
jgi:O-antigen/teichoic acid export membrane protein